MDVKVAVVEGVWLPVTEVVADWVAVWVADSDGDVVAEGVHGDGDTDGDGDADGDRFHTNPSFRARSSSPRGTLLPVSVATSLVVRSPTVTVVSVAVPKSRARPSSAPPREPAASDADNAHVADVNIRQRRNGRASRPRRRDRSGVIVASPRRRKCRGVAVRNVRGVFLFFEIVLLAVGC